MKKNIAFVCLNNVYSRKFGKQFADYADMFFADINAMLEYNLVNQNMIDTAGVEYFTKQENRIIEEISSYENMCIVCNFALLVKNNNYEKLKSNCIMVYLSFTEAELTKIAHNNKIFTKEFVQETFAYPQENLIATNFCDIVVKMTMEEEKNLKLVKRAVLKKYS